MDALPPSEVTVRARKWPIAVVLFLVAAGSVGGFFFLERKVRDERRHAEVRAFASLERCLLGRRLPAGEKVDGPLRLASLAAFSDSREEREPWPGRCAKHAHALREALRESGKADRDEKDLAFRADKLGAHLKARPFAADDDGSLPKLVGAVWDLAEKEKYPELAADGPPPPALKAPLRVDVLAKTSRFELSVPLDKLARSRGAGDTLHIGFSTPDGVHKVCTRPANATLRCARAKGGVAPFQFLGDSDGASPPTLFSGAPGLEGKLGIFRGDLGTSLGSLLGLGSFVTETGTLLATGYDDRKDRFVLFRAPKEGAMEEIPFALKGVLSGHAFQLRDFLFWVDGDRLHARTIRSEGAPFGPDETLGELSSFTPVGPDALRMCKTNRGLFLLARAEMIETLFVFQHGKWSPPKKLGGRGGYFTCTEDTMTITRADATRSQAGYISGEISSHTCTPSDCDSGQLDLAEVFGNNKTIAATKLWALSAHGKSLLIWRTVGAGLRARYAPFKELAKTADMVLFDDHTSNLERFVDMRILTQGDLVLVLLQHANDTFALHIDAEGRLSQEAVLSE